MILIPFYFILDRLKDISGFDKSKTIFIILTLIYLLESNFLLESCFLRKWIIFWCFIVLWKISWKILFSVWLCDEKWAGK
jgi:hypothetical protein